ncbi:MAG TPA: ABC transporter permease [Anaerolineales bacterium]|nr:ABC transporter permease [Anaerolineales bacterium]
MIDRNHQFVNDFDASKQRGLIDFVSRNVRELNVYRYALYNFVSTNLSSRYRRSTIGFLWSLLNPLFTMVIMALVFSSLYKLPFSQFSLYLFSGLLPWNLITASLLGGSMSIINAESYLKKVYLPKIIFPLVTLGVEITNFLFSLISLFILSLFFGAELGWSILLLPLALLLLALFILGGILLLSILTVFFRDLSHILQIALLGLFYLTPILYPTSLLSGNLLNLIKLNPFYYFINLFHLIVYEATFPGWSEWVACIVLTVLSLTLGVLVFQKKEQDVIYRL